MSATGDKRAEEILAFWFGAVDGDGLSAPERARMWFRSDPAVDAEIRRRFGPVLAQAARAALPAWEERARGRLALVLLHDQFARNIYRGTPQAFAGDARALALCLQAIACGHDQALASIERAFLYMPLQHSERLEAQERGVGHYEALLRAVTAPVARRLERFRDSAIEHRDIIRRFGRFPHRNGILGRTSTPAELEFLAAGGARHFGQG